MAAERGPSIFATTETWLTLTDRMKVIRWQSSQIYSHDKVDNCHGDRLVIFDREGINRVEFKAKLCTRYAQASSRRLLISSGRAFVACLWGAPDPEQGIRYSSMLWQMYLRRIKRSQLRWSLIFQTQPGPRRGRPLFERNMAFSNSCPKTPHKYDREYTRWNLVTRRH